MKKIHKKWMIFAGAVTAAAVVVTGVLIWRAKKKPQPQPDYHQQLAAAIQKTEARPGFVIQLTSAGTLMIDKASRTVQTTGYLYDASDSDYAAIYVHTSSSTEHAQADDFDVTVSMYCDEKGVFDNTGSTPKKMDMTREQFLEVVDGYGLYHYDVADATEITYKDYSSEAHKGGQFSVTLRKPTDAVLEAYAGVLAEGTGEPVTKADLEILSAYVLYSVYDGELVTQTSCFTVEYKMRDGRTATYEAMNQIAYVDSLEDAIQGEGQ